MRVMIAGDTHGGKIEISDLANKAGDRKISHLFIVGDFGIWGGLEGHQFLDHCNSAAEANNLSIFAVLGNHENYDVYEAYQDVYPTAKGFTYVRSRVLVTKLSKFKLGGKIFAAVGGAVSIDKDWRLAVERGGMWMDRDHGYQRDMGRGTGFRTLWWPQEQLTDGELAMAMTYGKVDYLLTHDCSDLTPFKNRLKPDLDSQLHRKKIDKVIDALQPTAHFHGHMHEKYEWERTSYANDNVVKTYGLEADHQAMMELRSSPRDNWLVLETDTGEVAWQGEGMNFRSLEN